MFGGLPLSGSELVRRTWREALDDDITGLAVASFFPLSNLTDDLGRSLAPFVSSQVLELIQEQMRRLANNENGGLLTVGVAGALWSSSAAIVSIVGALNRAYDIDEARPWWKVRLTAISLTVVVAVMVLVALTLVLAGPALAASIGQAVVSTGVRSLEIVGGARLLWKQAVPFSVGKTALTIAMAVIHIRRAIRAHRRADSQCMARVRGETHT